MISSTSQWFLKTKNLIFGAATVFVTAFCSGEAQADRERGNFSHVVAGQNNKCYAKSVPKYGYTPNDEPRQQGWTEVYKIGASDDEFLLRYEWFSKIFYVICDPDGRVFTVRVGPWHWGQDPSSEDLAITFYRGSEILKSYSTLDISGDELADKNSPFKYANVSISMSHYNVFSSWPEIIPSDTASPEHADGWFIRAKTIDDQELFFDITTGEIVHRP